LYWFFIFVTKSLKEEGFIWLTVSKISVHWLALIIFGLSWGGASWWKGGVEQSCSPHGSQEAEEKRKEP
jgi:hypothetical protein